MNRIDIEVRSTFKNVPGSLITKKKYFYKNIIRGVSFTKNDRNYSSRVKDRPGVAAAILNLYLKIQ